MACRTLSLRPRLHKCNLIYAQKNLHNGRLVNYKARTLYFKGRTQNGPSTYLPKLQHCYPTWEREAVYRQLPLYISPPLAPSQSGTDYPHLSPGLIQHIFYIWVSSPKPVCSHQNLPIWATWSSISYLIHGFLRCHGKVDCSGTVVCTK